MVFFVGTLYGYYVFLYWVFDWIIMNDCTDIEVVRGNDLYFPQGNENGDYYEPLFIARSNGKMAHGRTPAEAIANLED